MCRTCTSSTTTPTASSPISGTSGTRSHSLASWARPHLTSASARPPEGKRTACQTWREDDPVCDFEHDLPPLDEDEFVLDTPVVREFVGATRGRIDQAATPAHACGLIEPLFTRLLADQTWLPRRFQEPAAESGMGGGIGQWLLFRAADRSLSLFSLVVPPGAMTPVHDHLAWGLVGLYKGSQDEELYRPERGRLELTRRRPLSPG